MESVNNKVIAIIGASSRIGYATALRLSASGAKLALGAPRLDQLLALATIIEDQGGSVIFAETDMIEEMSVQVLVDIAKYKFGHLDVLIMCSGGAPISNLDEWHDDDWNEMIDVSFKGITNGISASLPIFRQQRSGHFISIITTAGIRIVPSQEVKVSTTNAVLTLLEELYEDSVPFLRVTSISSSNIKTEFANAIPDVALRKKARERMNNMSITADEIARAVEFCISQPSLVDIEEIAVRPTVKL